MSEFSPAPSAKKSYNSGSGNSNRDSNNNYKSLRWAFLSDPQSFYTKRVKGSPLLCLCLPLFRPRIRHRRWVAKAQAFQKQDWNENHRDVEGTKEIMEMEKLGKVTLLSCLSTPLFTSKLCICEYDPKIALRNELLSYHPTYVPDWSPDNKHIGYIWITMKRLWKLTMKIWQAKAHRMLGSLELLSLTQFGDLC